MPKKGYNDSVLFHPIYMVVHLGCAGIKTLSWPQKKSIGRLLKLDNVTWILHDLIHMFECFVPNVLVTISCCLSQTRILSSHKFPRFWIC